MVKTYINKMLNFLVTYGETITKIMRQLIKDENDIHVVEWKKSSRI